LAGYELTPLSPQRLLVWDLLRDTDSYYLNHQVFLVDFTAVEELRTRFAKRGLPRPSYVACTLFAMSRVIPGHPVFNSYLREFPLTRLALFQGVDVAYTLEKFHPDGSSVLSLSILQHCDSWSFAQFLERFRQEKEAGLENLGYYRILRMFLLIPRFVRMFLFKLFCKPFPGVMRRIAGTVAFTSVGKHGVDFTTPLSPKSLCVSLGAVARRAVVSNDAVRPATSAYLTLTYDHRVADGRHCAKLGNDLKRSLEVEPGSLG
jgi:pyruvate/2-oxoglutarate dehydrogenase complex dihydrolipoamide acyltransferase (E2) component